MGKLSQLKKIGWQKISLEDWKAYKTSIEALNIRKNKPFLELRKNVLKCFYINWKATPT